MHTLIIQLKNTLTRKPKINDLISSTEHFFKKKRGKYFQILQQ